MHKWVFLSTKGRIPVELLTDWLNFEKNEEWLLFKVGGWPRTINDNWTNHRW